MIKRIAIFGSTGSIGKSLLKVLSKDKKNFQIELLTINRNYNELINQTKKFNVKNVIIKDPVSLKKFKKKNSNKKIKIYSNYNNLDKIFKKKIDYTMNAIVGLDGLYPTLKIIKYTKVIAIANKEAIICGWNLIKEKLSIHKTKFIPVDSEHFSIWFALNDNNSLIKKIFLTASGGPFLNLPRKMFSKIKLKDALKHPNWKMGKKISTDSATMMNKVFELIEAKKIFNVKFSQISILVHPKSYIHAIVEFNNGLIKLIAHNTNMVIPIFNTLFEAKKKLNFSNRNISIDKLNNLKFQKINISKFPLINVLKMLPKNDSLFETVLVAANDELVNLFLNKEIKFNDISKKLIKFLTNKEFKKFKYIKPKSIDEILNLNKYVRLKIHSKAI